jgi:hypothetical protein
MVTYLVGFKGASAIPKLLVMARIAKAVGVHNQHGLLRPSGHLGGIHLAIKPPIKGPET